MQVQVDGVTIFEIPQWKLNVIANDIQSEILTDDIKRRIEWAPTHKFDQCFKRLQEEWILKLRTLGVASIPTDPQAFAELVFARPEYKNRSARDAESQI